jgi:hypothetical protein
LLSEISEFKASRFLEKMNTKEDVDGACRPPKKMA